MCKNFANLPNQHNVRALYYQGWGVMSMPILLPYISYCIAKLLSYCSVIQGSHHWTVGSYLSGEHCSWRTLHSLFKRLVHTRSCTPLLLVTSYHLYHTQGEATEVRNKLILGETGTVYTIITSIQSFEGYSMNFVDDNTSIKFLSYTLDITTD